MKSVTSFDEDIDATYIGSNEPPDLKHALAALGESWANGATEDFAVSFVTPINALYGNLLAVWPKEAAPEESLVLLSRDIETHLRRYARENKIEYFGLSLATNGDEPSSIPYSWLYDLRRGSKIMLMPSDIPSLAQGLWFGYTPLEASEIEKYRELEHKQQKEAVSDQALDRLDLWQRQFVHMLNTAMADMAQNGFTAMSGMLRTISSLLKQGQSLAKAIAQGRGQTIERRLEGGEIKTETDKMRQAILSQLADTSLPETIRAALRQQLKSLNEATKDQGAPLNAVRIAAKSGLVAKGDKVVSLTAFAAAFKALSTDRRPAESRLLSTPSALAMRGSVTAINTNAETVREILAFLSDKNQPKDVRATIAALLESGKPITVSSIISALAANGHAAAISSVITALADKGQMAGVKIVTLALAETGQQAVINAVVTTLAGSNQQLAAQTIPILAEYKPQVAALAVASLTGTQSPSTVQFATNAVSENNAQGVTQIVAALTGASQPAFNSVIAALTETPVAIQNFVATFAVMPSAVTQSFVSSLAEAPPAMIQNFVSAVAQAPAAMQNFVVTLAEARPPIIENFVAAVVEAPASLQNFVAAVTEAPPVITQNLIAALKEMPAAIPNIIAALTDAPSAAIQNFVSNLANAQSAITPNIQERVTNNVYAVADGLNEFGSSLAKTGEHVTETFRAAASSVTEFAGRSVQIGQTVAANVTQQFSNVLQVTGSTLSNGFHTASKLVTSFMRDECWLCKRLGKSNATVKADQRPEPI